MEWINIEDEQMPLEKPIIIKHKYGIEAIQFHNAAWRYWYTGIPVEKEVLENTTHWFLPS